MNCPYCDNEMNAGSIHGDRYALKWYFDENSNSTFPFFNKGIKLTDALDTNCLEGYFCPNCKKIIFDVSKNSKM